MATLKINGKEITVEDNTLILDAAKEAGYDIPTFCYQADLSRLGSCRMCLVEIEGQKKLQPSCVTPVMQDMEVRTETETILEARAGVLEFFLSNHGLDCPVCDKGGECELQDMVYKHGPHVGEHAEKKVRFHEKDYTLSPVIVKNSNRCVQCMRCVRVCAEAVGTGVLGAQGRGAYQEETSFLRTELDCDHCGNCIEVCPVGSFMRRPYRYKSRPWDLKSATSICPYCATGCRITIQERDGEVVRSLSKFGTGVNNELLCARGRFGFDFVNNTERLKQPMMKLSDGSFVDISWPEATTLVKEKLYPHSGESVGVGERIGAIASAGLTNEELFLFQKIMRGLFKTENIDSSSRWSGDAVKAFVAATGITDGATTIRDAARADTVFVVGSQVSDENPVTDYLLRLSLETSATELIVASPRAMKLDKSAVLSIRNAPAREGSLLLAIARGLYEKNTDRMAGLEWGAKLSAFSAERLSSEAGISDDELRSAIKKLLNAESVSLLAGTEFLRFPASIPGLQIFVDTLRALDKEVTVLPLLDRCNQRGAWEMGVLPGSAPGFEVSGSVGMDTEAMLQASANGALDMLYVVGEDVVNTFPDEHFARKALGALKFLIVQDSFMTETAQMADLVLPAATFAEKSGSVTNQEGRVQATAKLLDPPGEARGDFEIFSAIAALIEEGYEPSSVASAFDEIRRATRMYSDIEFSEGKDSSSLVSGAGAKPDITKFMKSALGEVSTEPVKVSGPGELRLVTGNHLYFSGSLSQYSEILNRLLTDSVVELSDVDAKELGLKPGDRVVVKGEHNSFLFILRTRKGTRSGVAFIAENYADTPVNRYFRRSDRLPLVSIKKA